MKKFFVKLERQEGAHFYAIWLLHFCNPLVEKRKVNQTSYINFELIIMELATSTAVR